MAQRKNFGVRMGRPPGVAGQTSSKLGAAPRIPTSPTLPAASPMESFAPGLPAKAFGMKKGGYACMPSHHDDPRYCKGGKA